MNAPPDVVGSESISKKERLRLRAQACGARPFFRYSHTQCDTLTAAIVRECVAIIPYKTRAQSGRLDSMTDWILTDLSRLVSDVREGWNLGLLRAGFWRLDSMLAREPLR